MAWSHKQGTHQLEVSSNCQGGHKVSKEGGQELSRRGSEGRQHWVGEGVLRRAWGEAVREATGGQAGQAPGAPRGSGHPCQRCPRGWPRTSLQAGHWGRWDGGRWERREWQSDCRGSGRGAPAGSCSAEAFPETKGMWAAEGSGTRLGRLGRSVEPTEPEVRTRGPAQRSVFLQIPGSVLVAVVLPNSDPDRFLPNDTLKCNP